jgi:hypothetical protein
MPLEEAAQHLWYVLPAGTKIETDLASDSPNVAHLIDRAVAGHLSAIQYGWSLARLAISASCQLWQSTGIISQYDAMRYCKGVRVGQFSTTGRYNGKFISNADVVGMYQVR